MRSSCKVADAVAKECVVVIVHVVRGYAHGNIRCQVLPVTDLKLKRVIVVEEDDCLPVWCCYRSNPCCLTYRVVRRTGVAYLGEIADLKGIHVLREISRNAWLIQGIVEVVHFFRLIQPAL